MKTTRYIARCRGINGCGAVTSALVSDDDLRTAQKNDESRWHVANPSPVGFHLYRGSFCITCRACSKKRYAMPVRGKFNPKHECNAKCMSSVGFVCECSCGGKNHGGAHAS